MSYDYKSGKKRVEDILTGNLDVIDVTNIPTDESFTFENAYHAWISAVFVDIRNSTTLMARDDQEYVSKVVRSFTSEIIEILRSDDALREIGIRGDCVYAVYSTPTKQAIYDVFDHTIFVNTYIDMLNALLKGHGYDQIKAGIGMATGYDHAIKAGRKGVGINSTVWMGDAVSEASKLSGHGEKTVTSRMVISKLAYDNFIEILNKETPNADARDWFKSNTMLPFSSVHCGLVKSKMHEWIKDGMPE